MHRKNWLIVTSNLVSNFHNAPVRTIDCNHAFPLFFIHPYNSALCLLLPSTECVGREKGGCIENMIWHFCQLNAFAFSFSAYRSVWLRMVGCNVMRTTRHMHREARIVSRSDPKLWFQLLDTPDFEKFFTGANVRVIRTPVNNARPSINSKLIYDSADSWFVISRSQLRRSRYNNPLLIHVASRIVPWHSRSYSALR